MVDILHLKYVVVCFVNDDHDVVDRHLQYAVVLVSDHQMTMIL